MLNTQVAYWANVETKRHNLATEAHQRNVLALDKDKLDEQVNFWAAQVAHWQNELSETTRHNLVTEGLSARELKLKGKQAKAALQQAEAALKNAETNRRDLVNKATSAAAAYRQSSAALSQADTAAKRQEVDANRADYQNALDIYKMLNTLAQNATEKAQRDKLLAEAEKIQKHIKYYEVENIFLPIFQQERQNAANLINSLVGSGGRIGSKIIGSTK